MTGFHRERLCRHYALLEAILINATDKSNCMLHAKQLSASVRLGWLSNDRFKENAKRVRNKDRTLFSYECVLLLLFFLGLPASRSLYSFYEYDLYDIVGSTQLHIILFYISHHA